MTTRSKNRRLIQVSVKPDYYEVVRAHCEQIDVPIALWVRSLIQRELSVPTVEHPALSTTGLT